MYKKKESIESPACIIKIYFFLYTITYVSFFAFRLRLPFLQIQLIQQSCLKLLLQLLVMEVSSCTVQYPNVVESSYEILKLTVQSKIAMNMLTYLQREINVTLITFPIWKC